MAKFFSDPYNWILTIWIPAGILLFVFLGFKFSHFQNMVFKLMRKRQNHAQWKNKNELLRLIKEYEVSIADLKERTKKLAQSERETAWREMAQLVAHEIKNPLTPLKLGVQLLKKSWENKDQDFDQKFERFTDSFIEQIETLTKIVSEFSNFAKMPDMVLEKLDLKSLLERIIAVYPDSYPISIRLESKVRQPLWIKADKNYLSRAFNNLIKNAIESISNPDRGKIVIRLHQDANYACVDMEDNGSGIEERLREHIFIPNFTTKTSGTGLGLAFVQQSLIGIGGNINFETTSGKGTTFYIRIPIAND